MNTESRSILDSELKNFFLQFEEKGYIFSAFRSKNMDLVGDYEEAVFVNGKNSRKITILYAEPNNRKSEVLSIQIENDHGDSFSIIEYLEHRKVSSKVINDLKIGNHHDALKARLNLCFSHYFRVINDHLYSVVFGDDWVHVPANLSDYK